MLTPLRSPQKATTSKVFRISSNKLETSLRTTFFNIVKGVTFTVPLEKLENANLVSMHENLNPWENELLRLW